MRLLSIFFLLLLLGEMRGRIVNLPLIEKLINDTILVGDNQAEYYNFSYEREFCSARSAEKFVFFMPKTILLFISFVISFLYLVKKMFYAYN